MPGGRRLGWVVRALGVFAVAGFGAHARAADAVNTVGTPGAGKLIVCRDWLVYTSCWSYNHIVIPPQVKIGDNLDLTFGSNNKEISFPVERILRDGDRCDIYNTPNGAVHKVNRIKVEGCKAATE